MSDRTFDRTSDFAWLSKFQKLCERIIDPVSYTHLTLPTIS